MRRDMMDCFLFDTGLAHEPEAALSEVTHTSMEQAARAAAGAGCEIVLFNEAYPQTAHGSVASDAGAYDAAADDQQVQRRFGPRTNGGFSAAAHRIGHFARR